MIGYLALGSNQGDCLEYLKKARTLLAKDPKITVTAASKIYETKPYGYLDQADFLNAVLRIETDYSPEELLIKIHQIEKELERTREIHWGPRTLDLDILLLGDLTYQSETLQIPHAELAKRAFVLVPLQDVYQKETLFGKPLTELIEKTGNQDEVKESKKGW